MIERLDNRAAGEIVVQCHLTFTRRMFYKVLRTFDRHPHAWFVVGATTLLACVGATLYSVFS